jgi:hypothetical protein
VTPLENGIAELYLVEILIVVSTFENYSVA